MEAYTYTDWCPSKTVLRIVQSSRGPIRNKSENGIGSNSNTKVMSYQYSAHLTMLRLFLVIELKITNCKMSLKRNSHYYYLIAVSEVVMINI